MRLGFIITLLVATSLSAQTPKFEVASIRENTSPGGSRVAPSPTGLTISNMDPLSIIAYAYNLQFNLLFQKIDFSKVEKALLNRSFDIQARGEGDTERQRLMLRTLLEERFGLKLHTETRQVPLWALRVKTPGKLKASDLSCAEDLKEQWKTGVFSGKRDPRCFVPRDRAQPSGIVLRSAGPISDFITAGIQGFASRPIVDETGLKGNFEWEIAINMQGVREERERNLRDALEDQLGLKFEPIVGPFEVVVVDQLKMPTPN